MNDNTTIDERAVATHLARNPNNLTVKALVAEAKLLWPGLTDDDIGRLIKGAADQARREGEAYKAEAEALRRYGQMRRQGYTEGALRLNQDRAFAEELSDMLVSSIAIVVDNLRDKKHGESMDHHTVDAPVNDVAWAVSAALADRSAGDIYRMIRPFCTNEDGITAPFECPGLPDDDPGPAAA